MSAARARRAAGRVTRPAVAALLVAAGACGSAPAIDPTAACPRDPTAALVAPELLGRPTDTSVAIGVVPQRDLEVYAELGAAPDRYDRQTATTPAPAGAPLTLDVDGLTADTAYAYRLRWRDAGSTAAFEAGPARAFHTARAPGQRFTFALQADPHLDENSDLDVYHRALDHELADRPDFLIDLGDTFMCEKHPAPLTATVEAAGDRATVDARYLCERSGFGRVAHSAPLFLVNGNHEGESGWLRDGTADNLAIWATLARKAYYPVPRPGAFYTGGEDEEPLVGQRGSWYAWQWGDALFVVLDPYWYTTSQPRQDGWKWTLGEAQYRWLARTLAASTARLRFVFIHHLVGGADSQARGGVEGAGFYEWGGKNADGTPGFAAARPGWGAPIHQLLVDNHVTAVFHGHDHVYVKQELDGIVYQEVPQPSARNGRNGATLAAEGHYATGTILSSAGHLRVEVGPDGARVSYVRALRPQDEDATHHDGDVADAYDLAPR